MTRTDVEFFFNSIRRDAKKRGHDVSKFPPPPESFEGVETLILWKFRDDLPIAGMVSFDQLDDNKEFFEVRFAPTDELPKGMGIAAIYNKLSELTQKTKNYSQRVEPGKNWDELLADMSDYLKEYSLEDVERMDRHYRNAILRIGNEHHLSAIILATACCVEAVYALEENDLQYVWECIDRAEIYTSSDVMVDEPNQKARQRAADGGKKKSEKLFGTAKDQVIALLERLTPEGGWKNKTQAADWLQSHLSHRPELEGAYAEKMKLSNYRDLVYRWLTTDEKVKKAFSEIKRTV